MKDSSNFEALDYTLPGAEYLRPRRNIIIEMDNQWNLPVILFDFDAWIHNSVRLWPEREKEGQREREKEGQRERERERAPLSSPTANTTTIDSGYNTVF